MRAGPNGRSCRTRRLQDRVSRVHNAISRLAMRFMTTAKANEPACGRRVERSARLMDHLPRPRNSVAARRSFGATDLVGEVIRGARQIQRTSQRLEMMRSQGAVAKQTDRSHTTWMMKGKGEATRERIIAKTAALFNCKG